MQQAIVGVFATKAEAILARDALFAAGFDTANVRTTGTDAELQSSAEEGGLSGFFNRMFGTDEYPNNQHYSAATERGHPILMVQAKSDDEADRATGIMESNGAIDVEERAKEWQGQSQRVDAGITRSMQSSDTSLTGKQKIPVIEEEMTVGKREVERGGVRIYMRETEKPVQQTINLKEERVIIERRPVQRDATAADLNASKERVFEVRTTGEVPVVSKTARVVEEVEIARDTTQRQETVRDTVRRTDVDVEKMGAQDMGRKPAGRSTDKRITP